ncbi:hypothetical protein QF028_004966 [Neobacillus sp. B4I6]
MSFMMILIGYMRNNLIQLTGAVVKLKEDL